MPPTQIIVKCAALPCNLNFTFLHLNKKKNDKFGKVLSLMKFLKSNTTNNETNEQECKVRHIWHLIQNKFIAHTKSTPKIALIRKFYFKDSLLTLSIYKIVPDYSKKFPWSQFPCLNSLSNYFIQVLLGQPVVEGSFQNLERRVPGLKCYTRAKWYHSFL